MHLDNRRLLHIGISYVTVPVCPVNSQTYLAFQQAIFQSGIEFSHSNIEENKIVVFRPTPPLEITVTGLPQSQAQFGQLQIVASNANIPSGLFYKETEAVVEAFHQTWNRANRQIISCEGTIRYLYDTKGDHAFKYLWENRLGQSSESLSVFGRPILGGGLRLVMPPTDDPLDPTASEVKIESYLQDPTQLFIEVGFQWPQPCVPEEPFRPEDRLRKIDDFINQKVHKFLTEKKS